MTTASAGRILFCFFVVAAGSAQASKVTSSAALDINSVNIKALTNSENFRYARELYRKGDFDQSAQVFQRILKSDCSNRLAQYHLQKILRKGPEFSYINDWLAALPCEKYNFAEEDFLPARFYYEKDTDLLLEQLAIYNRRYRNNKMTLSAKVKEYADTAARLEEQLKAMAASLDATKAVDAKTILELTEKLTLAKKESQDANEQVNDLKTALDKAATARLNAVPVQMPAQPMAAPDTSGLDSLHKKFAVIQARLNEIEEAIAEKNRRLESLKNNLEPKS